MKSACAVAACLLIVPACGQGTQTVHLVNDGPQVHDLALVQLDDGATWMDFVSALAPDAAGPPPGRIVGGIGGLSTGEQSVWTVTLGTFCLVPDVNDGAPHFSHGMVHEFTI